MSRQFAPVAIVTFMIFVSKVYDTPSVQRLGGPWMNSRDVLAVPTMVDSVPSRFRMSLSAALFVPLH